MNMNCRVNDTKNGFICKSAGNYLSWREQTRDYYVKFLPSALACGVKFYF